MNFWLVNLENKNCSLSYVPTNWLIQMLFDQALILKLRKVYTMDIIIKHSRLTILHTKFPTFFTEKTNVVSYQGAAVHWILFLNPPPFPQNPSCISASTTPLEIKPFKNSFFYGIIFQNVGKRNNFFSFFL